MNINKAISELKALNPTQRHIFFENFMDQIPNLQFKKHPYRNLANVDAEKTVVCRDGFYNIMYLMELIET